MGFVPLAYRAGSAGRGKHGGARVHIFWQRRIRADDVTTPWWYPSKTSGGSIREDRIVFPIPPGTHWGDAKPIILPGDRADATARPAPVRRAKPKPIQKRNPFPRNGMWFDVPAPGGPIAIEKPPGEKRRKAKHDARLVAAARELRDRYLEHVNTHGLACEAKYDVSRRIGDATPPPTIALPDPKPAALPAPMARAA
jgi:hypothetical protein